MGVSIDSSEGSRAALRVICLCAEWCGVCREWRTIFDNASAAWPSLPFDWIDIEDDADVMGDVDVETFPTILIARGSQALFFGPVQPSGAQLSRLIESLGSEGAATASATPEINALLARITSAQLLKS